VLIHQGHDIFDPAGRAGSGWAFGKWMAQVNFFPLIAGLVGSDSRTVGVTLHFIFAVIIGASFGMLFQQDVRGYGSDMGWGMGYEVLFQHEAPNFGSGVAWSLLYGMIWWFIRCLITHKLAS
jgi:hypothetical protein